MSGNLSDENKKQLLTLARKTIENRSKEDIISADEIDVLPDELKKKRGCFVTLNKNKNLRGCIGYILPIEPLYQAVIDNAYNAAFSDPRFNPVEESEYEDIHIEISVLTVPKRLEYSHKDELLAALTPLKDGVIIKKRFRSATFLPQVWEQLPTKEDFLNHLCLKAGLKPDEWEKATVDVDTYMADYFEE